MLALIGIGLVQSSRPLDSGFAAPQNVNIFGDSDTTFVSWDAVPGAGQYDVEVHLEPDCSDDPVATASTDAFFTQVGFTGNFPPNGYVRVRATNDAFTVFGPWSSIAGPYTPPSPPIPTPAVLTMDSFSGSGPPQYSTLNSIVFFHNGGLVGTLTPNPGVFGSANATAQVIQAWVNANISGDCTAAAPGGSCIITSVDAGSAVNLQVQYLDMDSNVLWDSGIVAGTDG